MREDLGPQFLAQTDPHSPSLESSHHPNPSAALLLPPHLLHGHRTMGLQAIMSGGLARGHMEGAW